MTDLSRLAELRKVITKKLHDLTHGFHRFALLDFPAYINVGDNAIWLGEIEYLDKPHFDIKHACSLKEYQKSRLGQALGDGVILLSGGGNFGDLWPAHQSFREQVISDFPKNRIIQLPQSLFFGESTAVAQARAVLAAHPDFHLLVRDQASLCVANEHLGVSGQLCPDMAHMLDIPAFTSSVITHKVVALLRQDKECVEAGEDLEALGVRRDVLIADWPRKHVGRRGVPWSLSHLKGLYPMIVGGCADLASKNDIASERLRLGLDLLSKGEVLVTDRLHAAILGRLGGKAVYFTDNSYGKLSAYARTWLKDDKNLIQCPSRAAAVEQALYHRCRDDSSWLV